MKIIRMDKVEGLKNKRGIIAKRLIDHENATVTNIILKPGDIVPEHSVPVDVFFYVVEGRGLIKIGDEQVEVKPRDIIVCPPGEKMSLKANMGETFSVLNVKTPSLTK